LNAHNIVLRFASVGHFPKGLAAEVRHKHRRLTEGSSGGFHVTGRVYRYKKLEQLSQPTSACNDCRTDVPGCSSVVRAATTDAAPGAGGRKGGLGGVKGKQAQVGRGKGSGKSASGASGKEGETLYTIAGRYDLRVTITDVRTGVTAVGLQQGALAGQCVLIHEPLSLFKFKLYFRMY
jgi:hypothetical protein